MNLCLLLMLLGAPAQPTAANIAVALTQSPEPELPEGLEDEPELPEGLDGEPELPEGLDEEPGLPEGLDEPTETSTEADDDETSASPLSYEAFFDARAGSRLAHDPFQSRVSLAELRAHGLVELAWPTVRLKLAADLVLDPVPGDYSVDLETGQGPIDLREANILLSPSEFFDFRLGRQILTWGTGDLLFINDLFPKDWNAFFVGRDAAYLKAPSDAAKLSLFTPAINIDFVLVPVFDADRSPDKRRLSAFDPRTQTVTGAEPPLVLDRPTRWFRDVELAGRLYRSVGSFEIAAYGYWGFWKSPAGFDPDSGTATYPALAALGASARGPVLGGILSVEAGLYDSLDDRKRPNEVIDDSQTRALVGYEHELAENLTIGSQYYLEAVVGGDLRHVLTLRVTSLLFSQNLRVGLFGYLSPSDVDLYLRPQITYNITDHWRIDVGANIFAGPNDDSFFGQLKTNTNAWAAVRYSI